MDWIRHGDVVLQRVNEVKGVSVRRDREVLAKGEVTGHFHVLTGELAVSEEGGERYVQVLEPATLSHQEHDTLTIPKGEYRVLLQREVDLLGEVRQVMD